MPLKEFSLGAVPEMDMGEADAHFKMLARAAVRDCEDRPFIDKPRKITIEYAVYPKTHNQGDRVICDGTRVECTMKSGTPAYKMRAHDMAIKQDKNGAYAVFNAESPDDVKQMTMGDAIAPDEAS